MRRKPRSAKPKKLSVVFDTNVFVAAALGGKGGRLLFELWKKKRLRLIFSRDTREELFDVLERPELGQTKRDINTLRQLLKNRDRVRIVNPKYRVRIIENWDRFRHSDSVPSKVDSGHARFVPLEGHDSSVRTLCTYGSDGP